MLLYQPKMIIIFLEQLKSGFKRTIKWNKYRSELINQTKTNNLSYLIDPIKSIDYLSHHLKMKKAEHLFRNITHQKLKQNTSVY